MTATNPAIAVLTQERDDTAASIETLTERLKEARAKQKSLDEAIAVLTGQPVPERGRGSGPTLNDLIRDTLSADGMGHTPAEIADLLTRNGRETTNTTVSSILSRLRKDGQAENRDGRWFLPNGGGEDSAEAEPKQDQGPVGRERGYPPSAPEGSSPSGSTPSHQERATNDFVRDLDEEIPF
ncbi:hypothetical protein [Oceaniradius stylonematis]|uniref:hypothetical protein n=1 Tax=Oceaniradius stylonematis TaxID=2184161 RepID=UPI00273F6FB5|nr:hypothetical protein [Oceaniradius stylonematis]